MNTVGILSLIIIFSNVIFSYKGFTDRAFFDKYSFKVDAIKHLREYKRLVSSGFLHVNWMHLIFNMYSLYSFSAQLEYYAGPSAYLVIYFGSLIGGNLLSLFIHRHHTQYTAVGASGAVCGVIFSSIALFPDIHVGVLFLPSVEGWIFGILFIVISIYGVRSKAGNIGHEAHLGGALAGTICTLLLHPQILEKNLFTVLLLTIPILAFIYVIAKWPNLLMLRKTSKVSSGYETIDDEYNRRRKMLEMEVNQILEKINYSGFDSLSAEEKEILKRYANRRK